MKAARPSEINASHSESLKNPRQRWTSAGGSAGAGGDADADEPAADDLDADAPRRQTDALVPVLPAPLLFLRQLPAALLSATLPCMASYSTISRCHSTRHASAIVSAASAAGGLDHSQRKTENKMLGGEKILKKEEKE